MTLARRLKSWQGPRTAAEAAADLGVNRRTYENWIQGRKRPSGLALTTLLQLIADPEAGQSKRPNKP